MTTTAEKFIGTKQIASEINERCGVVVSERFVRSAIRAGVKPRLGFNVRFSDFLNWWLENPDFSPRATARTRAKK